jgi:hypothetical protein
MIYKTLSTVVDDFFAYDIFIMFLWMDHNLPAFL